MKWRMIQYNCDHARICIQQDYLGPSPIFNHCKFQWISCITQGIYNSIKAEIKDHDFYNISDYDVTGHPTICIDAKLLIALKHLGYGCTMNAWTHYFFQMGESTRCLCVEIFCKTIAQKVLLCVSDTCGHTQVQIHGTLQNSMNVFMEFQECWAHLTAYMHVGKIVLLLTRDCTLRKKNMPQLSWKPWQTTTCGFGMQNLVCGKLQCYQQSLCWSFVH